MATFVSLHQGIKNRGFEKSRLHRRLIMYDKNDNNRHPSVSVDYGCELVGLLLGLLIAVPGASLAMI